MTEEENFFTLGDKKMNENWYALCISILTKLTPDQAFMCLQNPNFKHAALEVDEIKEMKRLREQEHYTCKDLAEMFGIHRCTIARLFKRIEQTG